MRVLCTTLGSPSHGRAQLPVLRALAAAGHDVLVATTPTLAAVFQHDDVRVLSCLPDLTPSTFAGSAMAELTERTDLDEAQRQELMRRLLAEAISGTLARKLLDLLIPVAEDFRPDLVLRDGMDLSSVLMAEKFGIPQLPTPSGTSNTLDPAHTVDSLNTLRGELSLPTVDDPLAIAAHGRIDYVPPAFSYTHHLPGSLAYRQTVNVDRTSVLPPWVAELPTDRPLVFAALGTALPQMLKRMGDGGPSATLPVPVPDPAQTLKTITEAAAQLDDCTVIVATAGMTVDGTGLPPHVHLTERLPQPLLLEAVDLFLTHGGFNSVRESLRTATPTAVLPQFGDQYLNARRTQELGLGREITDRSSEGIAAACRDVLADTAVHAQARRARLAMLTLPEVESAVTDLEKLTD
ncbi:glycosyltransferase [Streptomyces pinistramenti]|uniref:glycosyltransferase n=1 Tax=Streptomyces pinistramenti TaxID=2884812 RepID=UPI001D075342|nr:glycosyltransferase [Streptomyces pinistramenti]MCB5907388.1 glycosyltransferase [Streptomyces pinistramenti]